MAKRTNRVIVVVVFLSPKTTKPIKPYKKIDQSLQFIDRIIDRIRTPPIAEW